MQSICRGIPLRVSDRFISSRVARRHTAADEARLVAILLEEAAKQLQKYRAWSTGFMSTLDDARLSSREDLGANFVWQDEIIEFWEPFTGIQHELLSLHDGLLDLDPGLASQAEPHLDPPAKAQIEFATERTEFLARPGFDRNQIAYDSRRLRAWHLNFAHWVEGAVKGIRQLRSEI